MITDAFAALLTTAGVTTPLRPRRKQGEAEAITFMKVSGVDEHAMSGPTGLRNERWQLDVWSDRYGPGRVIADAVIAALNGKKGTIAGHTIEAIIQLDDQEDSERDADGGDTRQYNVSLDFRVFYW